MAMIETLRTRAPRGTKTLTQAFFAALEEIPDDRRAAVAKAAQSAIREELRARREKEKSARSPRGRAAKPNGSRQSDAAKPARRARRTRSSDTPA